MIKFSKIRAQSSITRSRPLTGVVGYDFGKESVDGNKNYLQSKLPNLLQHCKIEAVQNFRIYSCQRPFGIQNLKPNRFASTANPSNDLQKLYENENRKFVEDFRRDKETVALTKKQ